MLDVLQHLDFKILLWFNTTRSDWLDQCMIYLSKTWPWIPLYFLVIFYFIFKERKKGLIVLTALIICILITDSTSARMFKPFFERLRPCWNTDINTVLDFAGFRCAGRYGFFSSHASNTSSFAFFLIMYFKNINKGIYLLFVYPLIVSLSRIYLGAHYFTDVITGLIYGYLISLIVYQVLKWFLNKYKIQ
jgi:undecaprenyl-diphosphatase